MKNRTYWNWLYYSLTLAMLAAGGWLLYIVTAILLSWVWILVIVLAPVMAVALTVAMILLLRVVK